MNLVNLLKSIISGGRSEPQAYEPPQRVMRTEIAYTPIGLVIAAAAVHREMYYKQFGYYPEDKQCKR